jgi:hypothetical protein
MIISATCFDRQEEHSLTSTVEKQVFVDVNIKEYS